ncbi:hypothetical protein [Methylobacterium gnaphalii]|uniref:Uncharacterized protein n=1 Tax=Methylobacterium gnaphalii TaxID=1010610 RepID=A0A512JIK4_9HYPH|nr:hypothetical protein [Methylobacterium gnaphalii]GEP09753.1 hypothetical protein MGN01_15980 [Methylobacterium gnaphalii]GJD70530.1 hypothetical protein MMMDOFMJ_3479 [Methylobacterium gnaphalii]GLS51371.1 hypothetical protein GCM10007885_42280 [Methylobacterium gnaphalii]
MRNLPIDPRKVPGWGVDANPENDPTYPMRDRSNEKKTGMDWKRPPQQRKAVEILRSIERNNLTAVFGTSTPPSGVSGMIRRQAFRYSESEWAHWLLLMAADRVNVVEGLAEDLSRGRIPNIPGEMGIRSELAHNRSGLVTKALIAGAVLGVGVLAVRAATADRDRRREARQS